MAIHGAHHAVREHFAGDCDAPDEHTANPVLRCGTLMAHLWLPDPQDADAATAAGGWMLQPLGDAIDLGADVRLLRATTPEGTRWVLLAPPSVRVNGSPASAGIIALRDRDEIRTDGRRAFFSTESLAALVPYPGGDRPAFCPRCRLEIPAATLAVSCPQCGTWHHESQSDELPCWTYAERCALCDQPTGLDAGFRWTPEDL